jgi:hypothetical protein
LEDWMRSLHANMGPQPTEGKFLMMTTTTPWNVTSRNSTSAHGINATILITWPTAILWVKCTTKLFFHLLDVTVLNSWTMLSSYGAKYTHQYFRLLLVRNLSEEAIKSQDCPTPRLVVRRSVAATNAVQLKSRHNQHCQVKSSTKLRCCLCLSRSQKGHSM